MAPPSAAALSEVGLHWARKCGSMDHPIVCPRPCVALHVGRAPLTRRPARTPFHLPGLELDPGNDALKKELEAVMNAIAERMARQRESLEAKEKAIEAFNEQNYKGAVDLLKKAIKLDPDNHIFYSNRAATFMALEQYEKALVDADECIRLQPTWAKGYSRRGAALFRLDKLGPARDAFEKGLELDPENATYVRCTKQELQLVMDAIAQRKEESLEFKERAIEGAWQRLWNPPE